MPRGFQGVEDIRSRQWSSQLLWDIIFFTPKIEGELEADAKKKGVPYPYNQWFPATSVEDQTADLEFFQMETQVKPLFFPKHGGKKTLKLTFIDDAAHLLHDFFHIWLEDTIQNHEHYIATISEAVKYVQVRRLNPDRSIITRMTKTYLVMPESPLVYEGSDKPDPNSYSITLVKVGIAPNSAVDNI